MTTVKPSHKLTFHDLLSQLSFQQACKLLGPEGKRWLRGNGRVEIRPEDVFLGGDLLRVSFRDRDDSVEAITTMTMTGEARGKIRWNCDRCDSVCQHVASMLAMVLDNKVGLGLAVPPEEKSMQPVLDDQHLIQLALGDRESRARSERMRIQTRGGSSPWGDYAVTSLVSGKTYRVALRGLERGDSYCSCPDFRTNTLGTCKHIMKVAARARRKFTPAKLKRPFRVRDIEVHLRYGETLTLHLNAPDNLPANVEQLIRPLCNGPIDDVIDLMRCLQKLEALPYKFQVFPDAEAWIEQQLYQLRTESLVKAIRRSPASHPLRTTLLRIPLLPYQLDGIAFAVAAGRAVLADDMGLGKTIQAVGVAELLARQAGIQKVLVVCPASLKSQWQSEVRRFCDRDVQVINGRIAERRMQYQSECFFTICNYEQVLKDVLEIEQTAWDLIILDEGQRIKNWETKTSRTIKALQSPFALVLSGTPLENRLEDLYSVLQFIDDRRLGPGFRFFNRHRMLDEKGRIIGYRDLEHLRQRLKPVLLRRTRDTVKLELPERTTELVRIPPTDEQVTVHDAHMQTVATILRKKYLTEMDLLRLRTSLLMCRLAADGTYLVNKQLPNWSSKLDRLSDLLGNLAEEKDRKIVIFSEWTTMLDLIQPLLQKAGLNYVRLDGSVPQKKRQELVHCFQTDPDCRCFITTNAGSTGLNLQAANTVINVDLPWNPAVLEQRIARAHRMGQQRNVQVFVLVTEATIEENLLNTLSAKKELALAALDSESTVDIVNMMSGADELRARLEILLGAKPEAPLDKTEEARQIEAARRSSARTGSDQHRERVAAAGGEMLGAVFSFLGELVVAEPSSAPVDESTVQLVREKLDQCVDTDTDGRPRLTFSLPSQQALDNLAQTLARLMIQNQDG